MYKMIGKIGAFIYCAAIVVASVLFTIRDANRNLRKEVVLEAGSKIKIQDFFESCPSDAKFMTDVASIDTAEPAVYQLKVFYDEAFEKDVILRIEDHTAPRAVALPKSLYTTWKAPDAADCVGYLYDLSGIAKVEFESEPVFREGGNFEVPVAVTDVYGNTASVAVPFEVIDDHKAPEIKGVHSLEMVIDDEEPDFFENVTITDDHDEDPVIKIDDSEVDYGKAGTYIVKYEGVDKAGNVQTVETELKIKKPVKTAKKAVKKTTGTVVNSNNAAGQVSGHTGGGSVKKSEAKRLAGKIMAGLWRKNQVETARAIFNWVHSNIYYTHVRGKLSLEAAAYRGFSRRSGDCYVYYACCKMLLDQAGIPNMMVKRYPVTRSNHYWNLVKLNGQWYHCDATVFRHRRTIYFMCTDKQINDQYHHFNGKLYPARAGGSKDFKPTNTPTPKVTATNTPTPKPTATTAPKPTATVTAAPTATPTAVPSKPTPTTQAQETPKPTATATPVPATPTATNTPKPTSTPKPTEKPATNTPKPTDPKPEDPKTEE